MSNTRTSITTTTTHKNTYGNIKVEEVNKDGELHFNVTRQMGDFFPRSDSLYNVSEEDMKAFYWILKDIFKNHKYT